MKKYKLISMLLLCAGAWFNTLTAQVYYFNKVWDRDYGGYNAETMDGVELLHLDNDSNIIVIGLSNSTISGNKTVPNCGGDSTNKADIWLLKLHQDGIKFYENTYGGTKSELASSAFVNPDGTVVIGGVSDSPVGCTKSENRFGGSGDFWLLKIDTAGQKVWDHPLWFHIR